MTTSSKQIKTLVEDIYTLFDPDNPVIADEDALEQFCNNLKHSMRDALAPTYSSEGALRMSQVGKPDRQVWLEYRGTQGERLDPHVYIKFLFGHMIEELVLFLAKQAGHEVRGEQDVMQLEGIKGHRDAVIDGVLVDVKSASKFAFENKFQTGRVVDDHSFGYPTQLSAYMEASEDADPDVGGWVAFDKQDGRIHVTLAGKDRLPNATRRMQEIKEVVASDKMPPPCYDLVPDGASGNMKLPVGCSYCSMKRHCYPQLRTFAYSNGLRHLAVVKKEPNVPEIT